VLRQRVRQCDRRGVAGGDGTDRKEHGRARFPQGGRGWRGLRSCAGRPLGARFARLEPAHDVAGTKNGGPESLKYRPPLADSVPTKGGYDGKGRKNRCRARLVGAHPRGARAYFLRGSRIHA